MVTNNWRLSDLNGIYSIVENSATLYPKELIIYTIRNFFSQDSYYSYRVDPYGFPLTPDHTNLPLGSGIHDNLTTRLMIGESFRMDVIYYPQVIIRHGGSTSVPISFNREAFGVKWGSLIFEDGYGNIKTFPNPEHFIFAGAWDGSLNIEVKARDLRARDEIVDLIMLLFTDIAHNDLLKAGVVIKAVSSGSAAEEQDRSDRIFTQTITLQIRSEWRRHIPIQNIIDIIQFNIQFGSISPPGPIAQNLTITSYTTLTEVILEMIGPGYSKIPGQNENM